MPEAVEISRKLQVGIESTAGVLVPATKRLQNWKLATNIRDTADLMTPSGYQAAVASVLGKTWTDGQLTGKPTYGEVVYPLSGLFGTPTPAHPTAGVLSWAWLFDWKGDALDTPTPMSFENGDSNFADKIPGNIWTAFGMQTDRSKVDATAATTGGRTDPTGTITALSGTNEVQTVTNAGTPTGGTFTLTFRGQTTAPIAFDAANTAVEAALRLLTTIGATGVAVTGSGPWVCTFAGPLAGQPLPAMTGDGTLLTGGTTPAVDVVRTTPGVSITPDVQPIPLGPGDLSVFLDTSATAFGTTQLLRNFESNFGWDSKYNPAWPQNASLPSFAMVTPAAPKAQHMFTVAVDATGQAIIAALRAGSRRFLRLQFTGPLIEGSIHYSFTVDLALDIIAVGPERVIDNGVHCRQFTASMMHDNAWGRAAQITVVNTLAAL